MSYWSIDALRDYLDARVDALSVSIDRRFHAHQDGLDKADTALNYRLEGMNEFRAQILTERAEFAHKEDIHSMTERMNERMERIEEVQNANKGIRSAAAITAAIVFTLLSVAFGLLERQQLTTNDISNQIQRESPWAADKPEIMHSLQILQTANISTAQRLDAIEQLNRFFCRTRTAPPANLPGC